MTAPDGRRRKVAVVVYKTFIDRPKNRNRVDHPKPQTLDWRRHPAAGACHGDSLAA